MLVWVTMQAMNLTAKLGMMRGYGAVSDAPDYTRNSGCGGVCGRASSKATSNGDVTAGTFRWDNGPQGVSSANHEGPAGNSTQWPSTLNMAATWDPTLALEWGTAMGLEFWQKGANIQEGPGRQYTPCFFSLNHHSHPHYRQPFGIIKGF
jgi:beta-glucosidase-like glycosyl hydrolase